MRDSHHTGGRGPGHPRSQGRGQEPTRGSITIFAAATLLLALSALSACNLNISPEDVAKLREPEIVAEVCELWVKISYDKALDTKLTKEQIRRLNATREAYCAGTTSKGETR